MPLTAAQLVADAAQGLDSQRTAELGAQLGDVLIDGARAARELEVPDVLEELFAREDQAGMLEKAGEQVELLHRQVESDARPRSFAGVASQLHLAARQLAGRRPLRLRAAQHRLDAGHQLARAEGLGNVVVGAQLEPDHAVGLLVARGQHDDRHR